MDRQQYTDDDPFEADQSRPVERYRDDPQSDDEETLLPPSASDSLRQVGMEDPGTPARPSLKSRVTSSIPPSVVRYWNATVIWVKGPQPPRIYKMNPIFPAIQHAPLKLMDRYAPKRAQRVWLLIFFWIAWLLTFSLVQWKSSFASEIPGYGSPGRLSCGARYWEDRNGCGINGDTCRPFANATFAFRCPANCARSQVFTPHAVGDQEIVYRNLVIGGPSDTSQPIESSAYRGDSFICGAAIHAGFVNDKEGGCGVLELVGEQDGYPSTKAHRIESIGFDSYFPHSFRFKAGTQQQCKDMRWPVMIISVFFTVALALFTASPAVFFWSTFVILFATTGLATDPPNFANYYSLLSTAVGRFLPGAFCMAVMYRYAVRRTLTDLTAQIEKTIFWVGAAWVGALNNYTFDHIPIQRLTPHDLKAQPGAIPALIIVVLSIFFIAVGQAWCFRIEGRLPRYLALYGLMGGTLLLLVAVPKMNVRIHHYILGLLFLPGTSFQTRPSLIYQGLLVGLFVNGIARWGFDSLLQTPGELFRDVNLGSLLPVIAPPVVGALGNNVTFKLGPLPKDPDHGRMYDGISVLVNDVERIRTYSDTYEQDSWTNGTKYWTWDRYKEELPEYFRFAYMTGSETADYTKAGTWLANGTWIEPEEGPS
ncbi:LCCL domain-containing protein [Elsinoe australis]|uniref:LCCL domain-containing protein n=1 Tax=Elsinoe australis TaxID=40998 RepID=A0A4U7APN8_9PEZI|nr:LCCL domain-containing protein [Elsinoe australis]